MKIKIYLTGLVFLIVVSMAGFPQERVRLLRVTEKGKGKINPMVDNIGYWSRMVKLGYVLADTVRPVRPAWYHGEAIRAAGVPPQNSPDIPVTDEQEVTQTENSVFIDPQNEYYLLNSNNSSSWISGFAQQPWGADALWSLQQGEAWQGSTQGVNGTNNGDPSTAIGLNGWWYVGRIAADNGQAVSYSKNQGKTWTRVKVGEGPSAGYGLLDKNHLWIDNAADSPYEGNLYAAWTNFIPGHSDTNQVQVVRSADRGLTWSPPVNISGPVMAQKLNHGVNLHTGPEGEVYAAWSIYDTWPSDETAIGFCRSSDGGASWHPAVRILDNLKGIRASLTGKNMRVHAFPSMAVDISTGPRRGTLYLVFPNVGFPGVNTGNDIDIYLIKSTDQGQNWSVPVRVNQDPAGLGKQHYFPWITCDPVTGGLCVIYYDDRNLPSTDAATFVSYSYDGGLTWNDFQVSDYSFTPSPVPGLAFTYFGDYIGIQSRNMKVYPVWTDNRNGGRAMSYTSPFDLGPNPGQPWIFYYHHTFTQMNGVSISQPAYGDSLYLTLDLKNIGDMDAGQVEATISVNSPYVHILDSTESYGPIGAGQVGSVPEGFSINVSDTIPDNTLIRFNIQARNPDSVQDAWMSHFSVEARAPDVSILSLVIDDEQNGNGNHRPDPGEAITIKVTLRNSGDFPSGFTRLLISSTSPFLVFQQDSAVWESIGVDQQKFAFFTCHVDSLAPVGTGVDLLCRLFSGKYYRARNFRQVIGMVVEDWETNTFTKYPWQSAGSKPWELTTQQPWEGSYCLRSGAVTDYQTSQFFLNYEAATEDSISFYVKTSSEQDYDYLMFSIDGVWQGQWSGETPWTRASFPVSPGNHLFKWIYLKDLSYAYGQDRAWVDFIALPAPVLPSVEPYGPGSVCAGEQILLSATAQNADSLHWSTVGDGNFENGSAAVTLYTPGSGDIAAGEVTLRVTAFGKYANTVAAKRVVIHPRPLIYVQALPGDTVCAGQAVSLSSDTSNIAAFSWQPGNFSTSMVVYDTTIFGGQGSFPVTLTVTDHAGCINRDSITLHFKDCTGITGPAALLSFISPNPATDKVNFISQQVLTGNFTVTITDMQGRIYRIVSKMLSGSMVQEDIDLQGIPEGIYLLSAGTKEKTFLFRLVVVR